jgi:hypothetical protein
MLAKKTSPLNAINVKPICITSTDVLRFLPWSLKCTTVYIYIYDVTCLHLFRLFRATIFCISRDGILKVVVTFVGEKNTELLLDGCRKYSLWQIFNFLEIPSTVAVCDSTNFCWSTVISSLVAESLCENDFVVKRGLVRTCTWREECEYKCMQIEWPRTRLGPRNMKWPVSGII